jgi:hypothetical protein
VAGLAALAFAARAFDAQHIELALDVTEYEIATGHLYARKSLFPPTADM